MVKFFLLVDQLDFQTVSLYNKINGLFEYLFKVAADYEEYLTTHDPFAHQPSTSSIVVENNDEKSAIVAPCIPIVLGTKRERLPDETVVRRSKIKYST
jgi:hypothetical protein